MFLELVALARHHAVEGKARADAADARCEVGNAADLAHVCELRLLGKHVPHVRRAEGEERQQVRGKVLAAALLWAPSLSQKEDRLQPRTQAHACGLLAARASRWGSHESRCKHRRRPGSMGQEALGRDAGLADALDGIKGRVLSARFQLGLGLLSTFSRRRLSTAARATSSASSASSTEGMQWGRTRGHGPVVHVFTLKIHLISANQEKPYGALLHAPPGSFVMESSAGLPHSSRVATSRSPRTSCWWKSSSRYTTSPPLPHRRQR